MAALLNPTSRRLAAAAYRRISAPAAAEPLVSHRISQERYSSSPVDVSGGFSEMLHGTQRYYVLGGKGGVGRTSMAASLAVKFAKHGEPTLIVSTDLTRSLCASFEQDWDVSDGKSVRIDGFDSLYATEIGCVKIEGETSFGSFINNVLGRMGLASANPFTLNEMLNRIPPGLEEAYALSELIKSIELQGTDKFRRIVLDAPSTGHTLKLLSANNWIEKLQDMLIKGVNAASFVPALKLSPENGQLISSRLEELRQQTARVRELLFDPRATEFIIVTIPTMMAVDESSRFHASLKKVRAHTRRLVVNQVLQPSASDCRFCAAKRREQARAFSAIREDRELGGLKLIQAPLLDVEVKGVPALRFLSDSVWK
ncbi:hypothetical protein SEVIR_7G132500v4 [Setaria viridis]|uniref:ArsA/GET3 Anion-transporting ATPase-like domain-containing protein n=1 Tax=Setaria viridis TaxID=4556 RepID=A0A4U6TQ82_SETVI|nr:ATPase ARSA1-like isoform X1 [Setaria viridis]TKW04791.1 hypothetical protein SEVIR_7G132500v2 [Setaria viridis]